VAGLTLIEVLFAISWHFLFGYAGVVSFGHGAFFAIGAYSIGVSLKVLPAAPFWQRLWVQLCSAPWSPGLSASSR